MYSDVNTGKNGYNMNLKAYVQNDTHYVYDNFWFTTQYHTLQNHLFEFGFTEHINRYEN